MNKINTYQLRIMFYLIKHGSYKHLSEVMGGDTNTKFYSRAEREMIKVGDIKIKNKVRSFSKNIFTPDMIKLFIEKEDVIKKYLKNKKDIDFNQLLLMIVNNQELQANKTLAEGIVKENINTFEHLNNALSKAKNDEFVLRGKYKEKVKKNTMDFL